jgi:6-phosphogluconolactonase (cycloisomerase 2 family)
MRHILALLFAALCCASAIACDCPCPPVEPKAFGYFLDGQNGPITGYELNTTSGALGNQVLQPYQGMTTPSFMLTSPDGKFLFVNDWRTANLVSLNIDPVSGNLTVAYELNLPNANILDGYAHHPSQKTFYMTSSGTNEIYIIDYDVNGTLTARNNTVSTGLFPYWLVINNAGTILYSGQQGTVSVFSINSDATLNYESTLDLGNGQDIAFMTIDANDTFLYGTYISSAGYFQAKVNGTTLTDMMADQWMIANSIPICRVSPNGEFFYAMEYASSILYIFSIDPVSGVLSRYSYENTNYGIWWIEYFNSFAYFVPNIGSGTNPFRLTVRDIVNGTISAPPPAFSYSDYPNYSLQMVIANVEA